MKRNKFSLSHYKLATLDMGELVPLTWFEALPGDTIQQATSALVRVSPLLSPVMHPVKVRIHHWFVPLRLIWDDFEDFITGGPDGTSVPDHPVRSSGSITEGTLPDYLGIPPDTYSPNLEYSALPERAYALIWNEHYRDQDLSTELTIDTTSGTDSTTPASIQKVCWEKDYFTTARPWEQKGDEITIGLAGEAPVSGLGLDNQTYASTNKNVYETDASGTRTYADAANYSQLWFEEDPSNAGYPNIRADLSGVSGVSVNDLRLALALQRYQEARAMYGSRYVEYLRYLGVRSSDARLQNPEYLGGGKQVIQFSEVLNMADAGGDDVGTMRGHGIAALRSNRYRRFFEEHGIVMTLMSVIPKSIYPTAIHKGFLRSTKEDYFQRELQFIGDQAVINAEIQADHSSRTDVFGYQQRYDNYRSHPSTVAGEFRSTLNYWHYGREFSGDVALNSSFVEATPTKRVNASTGTDCLYVMANHSVQARRMLTAVGKPRTF